MCRRSMEGNREKGVREVKGEGGQRRGRRSKKGKGPKLGRGQSRIRRSKGVEEVNGGEGVKGVEEVKLGKEVKGGEEVKEVKKCNVLLELASSVIHFWWHGPLKHILSFKILYSILDIVCLV